MEGLRITTIYSFRTQIRTLDLSDRKQDAGHLSAVTDLLIPGMLCRQYLSRSHCVAPGQFGRPCDMRVEDCFHLSTGYQHCGGKRIMLV